ncbi:class I SAM-dependent RNA methyltransferase [Defluviimonas aestuarii]|uniref:class I SAM-dependent RNA methyltransferase n=1 Tax=Albidovulum aestuarii TaxID=1130726 RepID=UPI00249B6B3C|nr:class I SAM-dependent RNA methyltransferase [Defluviimonas aestuarii]MDI3337774.1 class I SAM-dependent RNA methyltransferase [Defluviimonas aestuarii]
MKLTIERLGHLGDGIAPGPVFVPMALPGEVVEGEVADGRMAAPKIIETSPDRVKPACLHYRTCGGCALMHAADGFVADWKVEVVRTALAAQGLEASFRPVITSASQSRRRATLAGRRTKKGALVGFHGRASGAIVGIPGCRLLHPDLMETLPHLADVTMLGASRKGELALTVTRTEGGVDLAVFGGKLLEQSLFSDLAQLAERTNLARLTWNGEIIANHHPAAQRFGQVVVVPPAGAFLQATADGEAALVTAVREAVGTASLIADLFAGSGTFALPLAERAEVHAVEGEAAMLKALDAGWRQAQGLHKVTTEARDLFRRPLMPDELKRFEAAVIDPPRAGGVAQTRELAAANVPVIAAVSCNPITFARDARILTEAGYGLDWIQVVDQFRWSPHVELVARFAL